MGNKLTITALGLGILLASLAAWQTQVRADVQGPTGQESENRNPSIQTPAIQDHALLQGWDFLRNLKEPVQVGNGVVVSGESLAQFLLESQIPVVWGSEAVCGGSSCSTMYCDANGNCSYEDGQPGIDPIYLNAAIQTQEVGKVERVAGELAHEAFHRMRCFGAVKISQIEEYWAFYVSAQLLEAEWPKFDDVDPQDPQQLQSWFRTHGMNGYLKLAPYPGSATPSSPVAQASQSYASELSE